MYMYMYIHVYVATDFLKYGNRSVDEKVDGWKDESHETDETDETDDVDEDSRWHEINEICDTSD